MGVRGCLGISATEPNVILSSKFWAVCPVKKLCFPLLCREEQPDRQRQKSLGRASKHFACSYLLPAVGKQMRWRISRPQQTTSDLECGSCGPKDGGARERKNLETSWSKRHHTSPKPPTSSLLYFEDEEMLSYLSCSNCDLLQIT